MDKLSNIASILVIAASAIMTVCAVYMARFEYRLMEKIRKDFVTQKEYAQYAGYAKDEHGRFDEEFTKVWSEISRLRRESK